MAAEAIIYHSEKAFCGFLISLFNRFLAIPKYCQPYKHPLVGAVLQWDCNSDVENQGLQ